MGQCDFKVVSIGTLIATPNPPYQPLVLIGIHLLVLYYGTNYLLSLATIRAAGRGMDRGENAGALFC